METFDLNHLYDLQLQLDETIAEKHHVTYQSTKTSRALALLVEVGELCNETRCFKYWSNKGPSPKDTIIEEYADALHFFLSLGISIGIENKVFVVTKLTSTIEEAFLCLYKNVIDFINDRTNEKYCIAFEYFLSLGLLLGFSKQDIIDAYMKKLDTNYIRQRTNY